VAALQTEGGIEIGAHDVVLELRSLVQRAKNGFSHEVLSGQTTWSETVRSMRGSSWSCDRRTRERVWGAAADSDNRGSGHRRQARTGRDTARAARSPRA